MIITICFYCKKVLCIVESKLEGESGGICPKCLRKRFPKAYEDLKKKSVLTLEEIAEAETESRS